MEINKEESYTKERFGKAIGTAKTYLSNFHQLLSPIVDETGLQYWNSEGYYMALRTNDLVVKTRISYLTIQGGAAARKARKLYELEMNEELRVEYMRKAIKAKFDANADLKMMLILETNEIIEKNYWNDTLFGVDEKTLKGANILGKLLMEYRNQFTA